MRVMVALNVTLAVNRNLRPIQVLRTTSTGGQCSKVGIVKSQLLVDIGSVLRDYSKIKIPGAQL